MGRIILVTGGIRSGKSCFAETLSLQAPSPHIYLATCPRINQDADLDKRISLHQAQRAGKGFTTIEEELDLDVPLALARSQGATLLLECLGVWIGNLIHYGKIQNNYNEKKLQEWVKIQSENWRHSRGTLVVVSQEAGWGLLPIDNYSRLWMDVLGTIRNAFAYEADEVWLVASGLPIHLKQPKRK